MRGINAEGRKGLNEKGSLRRKGLKQVKRDSYSYVERRVSTFGRIAQKGASHTLTFPYQKGLLFVRVPMATLQLQAS